MVVNYQTPQRAPPLPPPNSVPPLPTPGTAGSFAIIPDVRMGEKQEKHWTVFLKNIKQRLAILQWEGHQRPQEAQAPLLPIVAAIVPRLKAPYHL